MITPKQHQCGDLGGGDLWRPGNALDALVDIGLQGVVAALDGWEFRGNLTTERMRFVQRAVALGLYILYVIHAGEPVVDQQ